MSEFKVIESQEEFDARIKERIERAIKKAKEEAKEEFAESINSLKDENASLKNEVAGYKESLDSVKGKDETIKQLEEKISGFERQEIKRNIALEFDLPFKLADRIQGDDEESMKADAKALSEYFAKPKSYEPPLKSYEKNADDETGALKKLLDGMDMEGE